MTERRLRSRAHVHVNKYISLSLPLDEVFDGLKAIGRRAMAAIAHPSRARDRLTKARLADDMVDRMEIEERDRRLATAEKTLVGLGFKKAEAHAAIEAIRPDMAGKEPHTIIAAALKATRTAPG